MKNDQGRTTRRSFFLRGGAVLGAGVATAAASTALAGDAPAGADELQRLQRELTVAADRDAIRRLHAQFTRLMETGRHGAVAELFDARARLQLSAAAVTGASAIERFFATHYSQQQSAALHGAYRRGATQADECIEVHADGTATATIPAEVELCAPLVATCTAAQMARLQGQMAVRRWEPGKFDARYVKTARGWKIADLRWSAA